MTFQTGGRGRDLDYAPCRYGSCRTVFRGPAAALDDAHVAVIGGSEVYGKYVERPFTDCLADRTGRRVVNLGVMNAGLDVFARDESFLHVAAQAETVVIQTLGAHNLSNRFYTVHPRRNDRFLTQGTPLAALYPEVDFSDFAFTRHMLITLRMICPVRFETVAAELRQAWTARMRQLIAWMPGRCVVLDIRIGRDRGLGAEPVLVTTDMLVTLEGSADAVVTCDITSGTGAAGTEGMLFSEPDRPSANCLPTPAAHEAIAAALVDAIGRRSGMAA